jgi:3-phenylpropionate/cinnamic acid dioxygenase small subunit
MSQPDLLARLERVEAQLAIQQLAVRYAMAVDARDIDTWLNLFVDDIDCGRRGRGREALRAFIEPATRDFYRTVHSITGHAIDAIEGDRARGRVYCRAEHEYGDQWIVMACVYHDSYERRDGTWYFAGREEDFFYTCDVLERPQDVDFARWPGPAPKHNPPMMLPRFPNWQTFWSGTDVSAISRKP